MKKFLHHFFIPHEGNNYRAKLLHHSSLFVIIFFLFLSTIFFVHGKRTYPDVLGISYSITTQELLDEVNRVRSEHNAPPLTLNSLLSQAGEAKASHMFIHNYWAHYAPDGTTPWSFIKDSGYNYKFAGENLAKGFVTSPEIVAAWLASPTHRENLLSTRYTDIGFAVKEGELLGEETVLVVQMFGATNTPPLLAASQEGAVSAAQSENLPTFSESVPDTYEVPKTERVVEEEVQPAPVAVVEQPIVNLPAASRNIVFVLLAFLLGAFVLDLLIIERKKLPRLVGHNIDHIVLIGLFLVYVLLFKSGVTL